jgi:hypothetical protein
MRYLFVGYIVSLLSSLFIASWQIAFFAVALEFLLGGFILIRMDGLETWTARIQACDLIFLRALIAPAFLMGLMKKSKFISNYNTVPANFVIWTFAVVLLIASFWFGQILFPSDFQSAGYLGTAIAGALIGIFVLANQTSVIGQIVGILTLEASIVLSEIVNSHHQIWGLQMGLSLVFIWMILVIWRFLKHFSALETAQPEGLSQLLEEKEVL